MNESQNTVGSDQTSKQGRYAPATVVSVVRRTVLVLVTSRNANNRRGIAVLVPR